MKILKELDDAKLVIVELEVRLGDEKEINENIKRIR